MLVNNSFRNSEISNVGRSLALLLFLVFPNLFFYYLSAVAGVGRPYIDIDYLLPMSLAAFGFRKLGVFFLFLLMLVDLLLVAGQLFPVVRVGDVLYLIGFFFVSSVDYQFTSFLILVVLVVKCFLAMRFGGRGGRGFPLAVCAGVFFVSTLGFRVEANGEPHDIWRLSGDYLVSSQLKSFVEYRGSEFFKDVYRSGEPFEKMPDGASAVSSWSALKGRQGAAERLLLIVVESWGVLRQSEIQAALLRPLQAVASGKFEQGVLPFDGVTVGGELRELCQLAPNHFNLSPVLHGFESCLPNRLRAQGYKTLSMHGAVSLMYDRRDWYPRAGFEDSIFYESKPWPMRCHSFPGACDLDLMGEIPEYFSGGGKRFMYWLTLNSHPMYDERDIRVDVFSCEDYSIVKDSRACRHLKLQAQFFYGLARLLADKDMRGVHVLLVGDHRPQLIESQNYKSMFEFAQVPWVSFVVD